jgi:hypothetical protein
MTNSLLKNLDDLDNRLRELLVHPEATQADKATIVLARNNLMEIRRRRMPRWTPCDPKTLPPRSPDERFARVPDWLREWEDRQEAGNA